MAASMTSAFLNSTPMTFIRTSFNVPASQSNGTRGINNDNNNNSNGISDGKNLSKFLIPVAQLTLGKFDIDIPVNFLENVRTSVAATVVDFAKEHFQAIGDSLDAFGSPKNVVDYVKADNGSNMVFAAKVITFLVLAAFQNLYLATAGVALTYIHAIEQFQNGSYGECVISLALAHVMAAATPLFSAFYIAGMGLELARECEGAQQATAV